MEQSRSLETIRSTQRLKSTFCSQLSPPLKFLVSTHRQRAEPYNITIHLLWAKPTKQPTSNQLGCANCQDAGPSRSPRVSLCQQTGCCPQSTSSRAADPLPNPLRAAESVSGLGAAFSLHGRQLVFILKLVFAFNLPRSSGGFTEEFAYCCLRHRQMNVQTCPAFIILLLALLKL